MGRVGKGSVKQPQLCKKGTQQGGWAGVTKVSRGFFSGKKPMPRLSLVPLYLTRYGGERRHRLSESGSKPNVTALEHS